MGLWYSGNTSRLQREAGSSILPRSTNKKVHPFGVRFLFVVPEESYRIASEARQCLRETPPQVHKFKKEPSRVFLVRC